MKNIKRILTSLSYYFAIIAALILSSCKSGFKDQPQTFFKITKGPQDGERIYSKNVAFEWQASVDKAEYRYRMIRYDENNSPQNYIEMTPWDNKTGILFENIDEGKYRFYVEARYNAWSGSDMRTFVVDAMKGPAVAFFKSNTTAKLGEETTISIWIEDVDSFAVAIFEIYFDYTTIEFLGANSGSLIAKAGVIGHILPNFKDENNNALSQANQTGKISVALAILKGDRTNSPFMIAGSGKIIDLKFKPFTKPVNYERIEFLKAELRKLNGNLIVATAIDGKITIE
jgi:hypothetical protein